MWHQVKLSSIIIYGKCSRKLVPLAKQSTSIIHQLRYCWRIPTNLTIKYEQIINIALGKKPEIPPKPIRGTSAYVVYPPTKGIVRLIDAQLAQTYPGIKEVTIRVKPGDKVQPPYDYRGDIGFLWAIGPTAEMASANCRTAASAIWIEIEKK